MAWLPRCPGAQAPNKERRIPPPVSRHGASCGGLSDSTRHLGQEWVLAHLFPESPQSHSAFPLLPLEPLAGMLLLFSALTLEKMEPQRR